MTRWEYRVLVWQGSVWTNKGEWSLDPIKNKSTEEALNHMGREGWELIGLGPVHGEDQSVGYMFKRPVGDIR